MVELPQHTYMRAALAIHRDDLSKIQQTYEALSRQHYVHPPQFFRNAATSRPIYPTTFVYEPSDFMFSLADTADDLDDIWCLDAVVGISLGRVPATRRVVSLHSNPSC